MTPPLRVLFVDRGLIYYGGVSKIILSLATYIDRQAVEMHFTSLKGQDPKAKKDFLFQGVKVHAPIGDAYLLPALRLRRLISEQRIALVVTNCFRSYLVSKLATLGTGIKIVYWVHGITDLPGSRLRFGLFKRLARHEALLFISQAARQANLPLAHYGGDYVVYNGVGSPDDAPEWALYHRSQRREFGLADDDFVVICTSSFIERKNQRLLIEAFDAAVRHRPQLQLLLVGAGELLEPLRAQTQNLACRSRIHFLGARADARRLLGLADLCVHPATAEAFGLTVAEAMLAHLPVIAADDAALPELIQNGETGLLFPPGDAPALTAQITRMVDDPILAHRLGDAAEAFACRSFAPGHFAEQIKRVLVAEAGRDPAPAAWAGREHIQ